ncbi:MAG: glycosyltransferase family 4 protein [Verrucomicrobiota bacterium]
MNITPRFNIHNINDFENNGQVRNLIIIVRADPIICGHSTEARNLAEAAKDAGYENVHIVSYPLDVLEKSSLPLKPLDSIQPYTRGIQVDRPNPIGGYKVLDGRLSYAISGHIVDLLHRFSGKTAIMDLYLVPHGQMALNAVQSFEQTGVFKDIVTIAEAVGSDITNVVKNAVHENRFGAAQLVLSNYLQHDIPVAVSEYTKELILEAGNQVDAALGTNFERRLAEKVGISYPAINTIDYTSLDERSEEIDAVLEKRGLDRDEYVLFLSRIAPAKGVDDLIHAYKASDLYQKKKLVICGTGPALESMKELAGADDSIIFYNDISDKEKGPLMNACYTYALPSKPHPEFVETFGIAIAEKMLAGGLGVVVTTRTGGIPEATGGNCLEHEAGDVEGLTQQLNVVSVMSESERAELASRAQNFALRFDKGQVLANLTRLTMAQEAA